MADDGPGRPESGIRSAILVYLKGMMMGAADIVPGISGGTVALMTGIYPRLIDGISDAFGILDRQNLADLFHGRWKKAYGAAMSLDFALFIPLLLGIATSFLVLSGLIHYLMENHRLAMYSFFIGLILASAYLLYRRIEKMKFSTFTMMFIGFVAGYAIVGMDSLMVGHSYLMVFLSGMFAITAMILPGISGAFILVMLGQYEHMLEALHTLDFARIALFIIGALLGLALFSRLISHLLHSYRYRSMGFLIGLMLGALRLQTGYVAGMATGLVNDAIVLGSSLFGFTLVYGLMRYSGHVSGR